MGYPVLPVRGRNGSLLYAQFPSFCLLLGRNHRYGENQGTPILAVHRGGAHGTRN